MTNGSPTMRLTVRRGLSEEYGSWNTICSLRLSARNAGLSSAVISAPSKKTLPEVGSIRRMTSLPVVDLPQPLSPTSPSTSRRRNSKLTPSTARTWRSPRARKPRPAAKCFDRFSALRMISLMLRLDPRIEIIAHPVAEQIHAQHRDHDRETGKEGDPPRGIDIGAAIAQYAAPRWR